MSTDPEPKPSEADTAPEESRPPSPSPSSSASDSSDDETDAPKKPTEWLATGRQKRVTAGNRMKSMLANEEPDSDMELLFAEDEDDQGFTDVGDDGSDVHMDSSSDDEDEKNAAEDDMEGEKELERQAKERKSAQRKRKAQDAIPAKFRKKVRIDPTTPGTTSVAATPAPAPRLKKKSERASWLPTVADMPTRASSRSTTRMSKEQLHAQMEEREARRLKQLEHMKKKAAKAEALKKPPMTQEERLQEAELVEKRNSKSLNRWEEAEKQREEERKAKLAALNERTLKGPVITFWSGTRQWKDGGATKYVVMEEKPKRKERKPKDKDKDKDKGQEKGKGKEGGKDATTEEKSDEKAEEKAEKNEEKAGEKKAEKDVKPAEAPSGDGDTVMADADPPVKTEPSQERPEQSAPLPDQGNKDVSQDPGANTSDTPQPAPTEVSAPTPQPPETAPVMAMPSLAPPASGLAAPAPPLDTTTTPPTDQGSSEAKPSGVLAAPVLAPPPGIDSERTASPAAAQEQSKSSVLAPPNASQTPQPSTPTNTDATEPTAKDAAAQPTQHTATDGQESAPAKPTCGTTPEAPEATTTADTSGEQGGPEKATTEQVGQEKPAPGPDAAAQGAEASSEGITATRRAIIYQNFDENAIKDKSIQTQILFGRKMNRIAKPSPAPTCIITNLPARYRDPKTGLPFHSVAAYREIQRLNKGEYNWSKHLGAWAGSGTLAAKGVPARFLKAETKEEIEERKARKEREKKEAEERKAAEKKAREKIAEEDGKAAGEKAAAGGEKAVAPEKVAAEGNTATAVDGGKTVEGGQEAAVKTEVKA